MDGSNRVSDFSIERILSPQLGHKPAPPPPAPPAPPQIVDFTPDGFIHRFTSGGFCLDPVGLRPSVTVPVPAPVQGRLQVGGMCVDETFYTCGSDFPSGGIFPNSGVFLHLGSQEPTELFPSYHHGYPHTHMTSQPRQKARMRTVFTDCQTKHLEALFDVTDYPAAEERAQVARSTGLSEETVRVWFKNRRARRKRQRSGSKVKSP